MLWIDFINSDYHDWRGGNRSEDRLDRSGWLAELLSHYRLAADEPHPDELDRLKQLRTLLFSIVKRHVGGDRPDQEMIAALNLVLAQGAFVSQVDTDGETYTLRQAPSANGWPQAMSAIASSFADMLASGGASRIRMCDNPDCRWIYYDETRNRSKRYCDDKMCGNLMKVRRFRARHKATAEAPLTES